MRDLIMCDSEYVECCREYMNYDIRWCSLNDAPCCNDKDNCITFEEFIDFKRKNKNFKDSKKDNHHEEEKNGNCISSEINETENNHAAEEIKETITSRLLKDANFNDEIIELESSRGSSLDKDAQKVKLKEEIIKDNFTLINKLGIIDKRDIVDFIDEVQDKCPEMKAEDVKTVAEIFINLKQSLYKLLHKLPEISPEDYDSLEILSELNVHEANIVLDEIKRRISLVKELKLKVNDSDTELYELQLLFERGLWIFGSEYESVEFTSNRWLSTVVTDLLDKGNVDVTNPLIRPDLIVIPNQSVTGIYSKNKYDENGQSADLEKILVVELKKVGCDISRKERNQVLQYLEQLVEEDYISENTVIEAYVLGSTVSCRKTTVGENITVTPEQYNIILNRAQNRLNNLERKIREIKNVSLNTCEELMCYD